MDPVELYNSNHRYPDENLLALWRLALARTHDECIGIKVAVHIHPTTLHALGFAWLSSSTLLDALQRLVRFYRIVTDMERLELVEAPNRYCLRLVPVDRSVEVAPQDYDTFFAALLIMCQAICGENYRPALMNMQRSAPACLNEMRAFFNLPLQFDQQRNEIWFDKATINDLLPSGNALLARENDQIIMRFISNLDKEDIVMQVKSRLIDSLSSGNVSERSVANLMHMSTRTLQRRLTDVNTSFKEIVDEMRRQLAIEYVRDDKTSMTEITFLLGYSEQANFTRAFRRWTGQSPSEFRNAG